MILKEILERWTRNQVARGVWAEFVRTKEFQAGIEVLRAHAIPKIVMGESEHDTAKRQSFQAGFYTCLALLSKLHEIHYKKNEDLLPPWEHVADPPDPNQPTNEE